MNTKLFNFAAQVREEISLGNCANGSRVEGLPTHGRADEFSRLALGLFTLQFKFNPAYQTICRARKITPEAVNHWTQIPAVPTAAFKELELSCIPPEERTMVFHSSGTTEQKPSRHFHHADSLAVYESSLRIWFNQHFGPEELLVFLTPNRSLAPHSSLIYMFDALRRRGLPESIFTGGLASDGSWVLDFPAVIAQLQQAAESGQPLTLLGTAFSFVHLVDYLADHALRFQLPAGSRVMETGGYKNRSRTMPKAQLHELITEQLGIPATQIFCEYGMSELSSQAYSVPSLGSIIQPSAFSLQPFFFPPWARVQIISPETGREVAEGQTGIIRVFDLANVYSVAVVQTEDLGVRRGTGFDLIGRAAQAEPRGCSLMTPETVA